jgi:ribonuclease III
VSDRDLARFIANTLAYQPRDLSLFRMALTHSSTSTGESYERLEFLGDRVLGLVVAQCLYERFPSEPEGSLSGRFNVLVARETCGEIGRGLGLPTWIKLGKQAREDGASQSDNVVGDVVEALIGALFVDGGLDAAQRFVRSAWSEKIDNQDSAPKHPKSALQELAAARGLAAPEYELIGRSGPPHRQRFTLRVIIPGAGEAEAEGSSKQEAETAAAAALLQRLQ